MDKKQWKHKITGGKAGLILSFIMLVGFSALAFWFHATDNSAIIIGRIVVIFAALAFALALYRALFFKVLIGRDGFFYQSNPGNGRHYRYSEIRKAWVSSGRESSRQEMTYCNYETADGKVVRFFITGADTDAVEYFLQRVEAVDMVSHDNKTDDMRDLTISGKVQGIQRIAAVIFIVTIFLILVNSLVEVGIPPIVNIIPIIASLVSVIYVIIQYCFYKIEIQKEGFFCRTNPFNGQYYRYCDIAYCATKEIRRKFGSIWDPGVRKTRYFHILIFADRSGNKRKVLYNKALFEYEINVLVSRIEKEKQR